MAVVTPSGYFFGQRVIMCGCAHMVQIQIQIQKTNSAADGQMAMDELDGMLCNV
jgi:hypothetical protein